MAGKRKRSQQKRTSSQTTPHIAPPMVQPSDPLSSPSIQTTNSNSPNGLWSLAPDALFPQGHGIALPLQFDYPPHGPIATPDRLVGLERSSQNIYVSNRDSDGQENDVLQASHPSELTWIAVNPSETHAKPVKTRQAPTLHSTIKAGGACLWCFSNKKPCGDGTPCNQCKKRNLSCARGGCSSLCIAPTIKPRHHYELDPDNFKMAQDILEQLKQGLQPSAFPVEISWYPPNELYPRTKITGIDQLVLRQVNSSLRETLVKPFTAPRSKPSDNLQQDAHRMRSLYATIRGFFDSGCFLEAVAIKTARVIVFFLMTIYTKELCKASLDLAKNLYPKLTNKSSATESITRPVRNYLQTVDDIVKCINQDWRDSLMANIFMPMEPQLQKLQVVLSQLALGDEVGLIDDANNSFNFNLQIKGVGFGIDIKGVDFGIDPWYTVKSLLRPDSEESMANPATHSQTINPSVLSVNLDRNHTDWYAASSAAVNTIEDYVFTNSLSESRGTEITSTLPDAALGSAPADDSAYVVDGSVFERSNQDFNYFGNQFPERS